MSSILTTLEKYKEKTNTDKSSYWKRALKGKDYKNIYKELGFGSLTKITFFGVICHFILSRILYKNYIFKTNYFYKIRKTFLKFNRQIDNDSIRHIFTFHHLKKIKFKNVCIIGDGKANFVLQSLCLFPNKKIFSVNLTETLINDYLIIKNSNISDKLIKVVEKKSDLNANYKIFLIPSSNKQMLKNQKIDLFVNIDSFQEMNKKEVKKYFEIFKYNKSLLYYCNRESKRLPCGENILFKNYPHGIKSFKNIECPWAQKYYSYAFPFIHSYDGKHLHALLDFKNKNQIISLSAPTI